MFAFLPSLGSTEMIVILIVALLIFGLRLPSVMRSLGSSVNEFKRGVRDVKDDVAEVKGELDDVAADIHADADAYVDGDAYVGEHDA